MHTAIAIIMALLVAGCSHAPKTVTIAVAERLPQPAIDHPIPNECDARLSSKWPRAMPPPKGQSAIPFADYNAAVLRGKKAMAGNELRAERCHCILIEQWGNDAVKSSLPPYCLPPKVG